MWMPFACTYGITFSSLAPLSDGSAAMDVASFARCTPPAIGSSPHSGLRSSGQQVVLHGEQGRGRAGGHADLGIDVLGGHQLQAYPLASCTAASGSVT